MRRLLRPDDACVDAGASVGAILRGMLRYAPAGRHQAFEPLPQLAERLRRKYGPGSAITVHELALSDQAGVATFYHITQQPALSSLADRNWRGTRWEGPPAEQRTVPTARLDDVLDPGLPIRFMKLDVESAEILVLRGALRTLERWRPYVVFEHAANSPALWGRSNGELWELLTGHARLTLTTQFDWLRGRPPFATFADFELAMRRTAYFLAFP